MVQLRQFITTGLILTLLSVAVAGCAETTTSTSDNSSSQGSGNSSTSSKEPAAKKEPEMTSGQKNALRSAKDYLDMSAFSKKGLIQQLSSSAGEGYSKADATYAANHAGADWKAEAVEAAKNYLEMSGFSKSSLMEQLTSSSGDGYTEAQARYAVSKVY